MARPGSGQQQCRTCNHKDRAAVELALARGVSANALAKRYRGLSVDSLRSHARKHMPAQLRAALIAGPSIEGVDLDKLRERESQSLLSSLVSLRARLWFSLDAAEENGDGNMLARLSGQIHENLSITGKLLGDLGVGSTTINNVLLVPAYVEMRVELVRALAPFPDAREAVAAVLQRLEGDAAKVIEHDDRTLGHGDAR